VITDAVRERPDRSDRIISDESVRKPGITGVRTNAFSRQLAE
jgi:hypothetical protein